MPVHGGQIQGAEVCVTQQSPLRGPRGRGHSLLWAVLGRAQGPVLGGGGKRSGEEEGAQEGTGRGNLRGLKRAGQEGEGRHKIIFFKKNLQEHGADTKIKDNRRNKECLKFESERNYKAKKSTHCTRITSEKKEKRRGRQVARSKGTAPEMKQCEKHEQGLSAHGPGGEWTVVYAGETGKEVSAGRKSVGEEKLEG